MKTTFKCSLLGFLMTALVFAANPIMAQDTPTGDPSNEKYFIVSGVVKNKTNNKKMEYVNISVLGTGIGTVTNEDGEFTLKVSESTNAKDIEFSYIGFHNTRIPINGTNLVNQTFYMSPKAKELPEVVIKSWDARKLMEEAISKIPQNYSKNSNLLTGFYRETAKKGRNYINIAEAIVQIYKSPYTDDIYSDKVQILKGRKLLSVKKSDTLAIKLLGGPNLSIMSDIVKNQEIMLDPEYLNHYKFSMESSTLINDRVHLVVKFEPFVENSPFILYYGRFYIDAETLSFTRAEYSMDMRDRNKVTQAILRKKPSGLHFKPEEMTYIVSYKERDGITYLNYVRNEIRFKCDWKRRLFATNYEIFSEMVVTDNEIENATSISRRDAFNINNSLSDKVMNFYDEDFWGNYNIIEPSESLESAVSKLKKGYN